LKTWRFMSISSLSGALERGIRMRNHSSLAKLKDPEHTGLSVRAYGIGTQRTVSPMTAHSWIIRLLQVGVTGGGKG
jgi:hypothetical protein